VWLEEVDAATVESVESVPSDASAVCDVLLGRLLGEVVLDDVLAVDASVVSDVLLEKLLEVLLEVAQSALVLPQSPLQTPSQSLPKHSTTVPP